MLISTLLALAATLAPSAGEPGVTEGEVLGRSQGGASAKVHLRAEVHGEPITVVLTSGAWRQWVALEALLEHGATRRPARGRPRLRPRAMAGDKEYSSAAERRHLRHVASAR